MKSKDEIKNKVCVHRNSGSCKKSQCNYVHTDEDFSIHLQEKTWRYSKCRDIQGQTGTDRHRKSKTGKMLYYFFSSSSSSSSTSSSFPGYNRHIYHSKSCPDIVEEDREVVSVGLGLLSTGLNRLVSLCFLSWPIIDLKSFGFV